MAGYTIVPARCLHHIPDSLPFERAALTEPCCVGYNAVAVKSHVRPGDTVVILGPGPIGLLCAEMARIAGAGILIVGGVSRDASRLKAAEELGVTHSVNGDQTNIQELIQSLGDGLGADLVVDATGASAAMELALKITRPGGQITSRRGARSRSDSHWTRWFRRRSASGQLQPHVSELGEGGLDARGEADQPRTGNQPRCWSRRMAWMFRWNVQRRICEGSYGSR